MEIVIPVSPIYFEAYYVSGKHNDQHMGNEIDPDPDSGYTTFSYGATLLFKNKDSATEVLVWYFNEDEKKWYRSPAIGPMSEEIIGGYVSNIYNQAARRDGDTVYYETTYKRGISKIIIFNADERCKEFWPKMVENGEYQVDEIALRDFIKEIPPKFEK